MEEMDWSPTHPERAYRPQTMTTLEFTEALEASLRNYYDDGELPRRYRNAVVLTFCWDLDRHSNLAVGHFTASLGDVFRKHYHYNVENITIPYHVEDNHAFMGSIIWETLYGQPYKPEFAATSENDLLIIYYVGHGTNNLPESNHADQDLCLLPTWPPGPEDNRLAPPDYIRPHGRPFINFSKLRRDVIDGSNADVLILLDCCYARSAAIGDGKEIIAASAHNEVAHNGPDAFSSHLIQQIVHASSNKQIITSPQLYCRLATKAYKRDSAGRPELRSTPIHVQHYDRPRAPIYLAPIFTKPSSDWVGFQVRMLRCQPAVVVLSVHLKDAGPATLWDLRRWLARDRPYGLDRVEFQEMYSTSSAVVLFKVTLDVWCSIPSSVRRSGAIQFIAIEKRQTEPSPIFRFNPELAYVPGFSKYSGESVPFGTIQQSPIGRAASSSIQSHQASSTSLGRDSSTRSPLGERFPSNRQESGLASFERSQGLASGLQGQGHGSLVSRRAQRQSRQGVEAEEDEEKEN